MSIICLICQGVFNKELLYSQSKTEFLLGLCRKFRNKFHFELLFLISPKYNEYSTELFLSVSECDTDKTIWGWINGFLDTAVTYLSSEQTALSRSRGIQLSMSFLDTNPKWESVSRSSVTSQNHTFKVTKRACRFSTAISLIKSEDVRGMGTLNCSPVGMFL